MKSDYIAEAHVTLSSSFHGSKVSKERFAAVLTDCINALNALDGIKKALFYGKPDASDYDAITGYSEFAMQSCDELEMSALVALHLGNNPYNLLHGIIGKATEAGELLEALFSSVIEGKEVDTVNVAEEIGDGFWYDAIILRCIASTFETEQKRNINKLRHRFPDKFTEHDANNRNLINEREALETKFSVDTSKSVI